MAQISNTAVVSEARGKIGSEVFSRNRFGAYIRTKNDIIQADSPYQLSARGRFTTASQEWANLSDAERNRWIKLASTLTRTNHVGTRVGRAGFHLFVSRKLNLLRFITSNPIPYHAPFPVKFSLTSIEFGTGGAFQLYFTSSTPSSDVRLLAFASPPVSTGVMSYNSTQFEYMNQQQLFASSFINLFNAYHNRYGSIPDLSGKKVFIKVFPLIYSWPIGGGLLTRLAGYLHRSPHQISTVIPAF